MDISTLVDIFRAEEDALLLGTGCGARGRRRAGVRSLRLVVFDRVPWPRPDILHKARRTFFGTPHLRRRVNATAGLSKLAALDPLRD